MNEWKERRDGSGNRKGFEDVYRGTWLDKENLERVFRGDSEDAREIGMRKRSRHDRVRNSCWSSCSDRDLGDNGIPPKVGRALGGYCKWHQQLVERFGFGCGRHADEYFRQALQGLSHDERGQSTVEYAVVVTVGLVIILSIGALANAVGDGLFVEHALMAASHNVEGTVGGAVDVFVY